MPASFFWHDYETWGADPRRDRICQVAGIRTDADFNEIGSPLIAYCRPALDVLPHPDACLVTGITPQVADQEGLCEAELTARLLVEFEQPETCGAGYNSLRFDDEVTRHLLYRNLRDPYAREWRNGNSRWDLIDPLRLAHALRPQGMEWPAHPDGTTSFKLEQLSAANGIAHQAHDALGDVRATIALVRRFQQAQPRLLHYALGLRDKARVRELLGDGKPLVHASARFPAALGCIAPVVAVASHPTHGNSLVCFDLRADPAMLLDLSVAEIQVRLFTPVEQLGEGRTRVPLKTVRVNQVPMLAPLKTLTADAAERWAIDPDQVVERARWIAAHAAELRRQVQAVFGATAPPAEADPDLQLYQGGFFSDADRRAMDAVHRLSPQELAERPPRFADPRLPQLLFRYRARNWPETLTPAECEDWDAYRLQRLTDPAAGGSIQIEAFEMRLAQLAAEHAEEPHTLAILEALSDWAEQLFDASAVE